MVRAQTTGWRMGSLSGWDAYSHGAPPPRVVEAVSHAYPLPETVRAAWREFGIWEKIARDREARGVGRGDPEAIAAWNRLAEGGPARTVPVEQEAPPSPAPAPQEPDPPSAPSEVEPPPAVPVTVEPPVDDSSGPGDQPGDGVSARSGENPPAEQVSRSPDPGTGTETVDPAEPDQPKRSRAEKQAAVRALLGEPLTDREIARRTGVSPSTVAAVRRTGG